MLYLRFNVFVLRRAAEGKMARDGVKLIQKQISMKISNCQNKTKIIEIVSACVLYYKSQVSEITSAEPKLFFFVIFAYLATLH